MKKILSFTLALSSLLCSSPVFAEERKGIYKDENINLYEVGAFPNANTMFYRDGTLSVIDENVERFFDSDGNLLFELPEMQYRDVSFDEKYVVVNKYPKYGSLYEDNDLSKGKANIYDINTMDIIDNTSHNYVLFLNDGNIITVNGNYFNLRNHDFSPIFKENYYEMILPIEFLEDVSEDVGLFIVSKDNKYSIIDKEENNVFEKSFKFIEDLKCDLLFVENDDNSTDMLDLKNQESISNYTKANYNVIEEKCYLFKEDSVKIYDTKTGSIIGTIENILGHAKLLNNTNYEDTEEGSTLLYFVYEDSGSCVLLKNGEIIKRFDYNQDEMRKTFASSTFVDRFVYSENGKLGLMDYNGAVVVKPADWIGIASYDRDISFAIKKDDDFIYVLDKNGKPLFNYKSIYSEEYTGSERLEKKNGLYNVVSSDGKKILYELKASSIKKLNNQLYELVIDGELYFIDFEGHLLFKNINSNSKEFEQISKDYFFYFRNTDGIKEGRGIYGEQVSYLHEGSFFDYNDGLALVGKYQYSNVFIERYEYLLKQKKFSFYDDDYKLIDNLVLYSTNYGEGKYAMKYYILPEVSDEDFNAQMYSVIYSEEDIEGSVNITETKEQRIIMNDDSNLIVFYDYENNIVYVYKLEIFK